MSNTWRPRDVAGLLLIAGLITTAYHNKESQTAPVPAPRQFKAGEMILPDYAITAMIAVVETKAGDSQIVLNDVRYKAPTTVEDTKFEISDLITL